MHFIIDKTQENYIRKIRLYKNLNVFDRSYSIMNTI